LRLALWRISGFLLSGSSSTAPNETTTTVSLLRMPGQKTDTLKRSPLWTSWYW